MWVLLAIFFPIIVGIVIGLFDDFKQKHKEDTAQELMGRALLLWLLIGFITLIICI